MGSLSFFLSLQHKGQELVNAVPWQGATVISRDQDLEAITGHEDRVSGTRGKELVSIREAGTALQSWTTALVPFPPVLFVLVFVLCGWLLHLALDVQDVDGRRRHCRETKKKTQAKKKKKKKKERKGWWCVPVCAKL